MKSFKIFVIWAGKAMVFVAILIAGFFALEFLLVSPLGDGLQTINYLDMMSQKQNIDIAFIGPSTIYLGIDAPTLGKHLGKNVINMSTNGQLQTESYYFVKELYKRNKPETVFIDVSTQRLYRAANGNEAYIRHIETGPNKKEFIKERYGQYERSAVFSFLHFREDLFTRTPWNNIKIKLSKGYRDFDADYVSKLTGGNYKGKGYWTTNAAFESGNAGSRNFPAGFLVNGHFFDESGICTNQLDYLNRTITYCQSRGARVILFVIVQPYAFVGNFPEEYDLFLDYMQNLAAGHGAEFYDFSMLKRDKFDRTDDSFYDYVHMNGTGAAKFEVVLRSFYNNVLYGDTDPGEYLYANCTELTNDCQFIYCARMSYDSENHIFQTTVVAGNLSDDIEYQFQYKISDEEEYITFRDWDMDSTASSELIGETGCLTVRVNVRCVGSCCEYEQYNNMVFKK